MFRVPQAEDVGTCSVTGGEGEMQGNPVGLSFFMCDATVITSGWARPALPSLGSGDGRAASRRGRPPVRAENPVHGSDQQSCSLAVRPVRAAVRIAGGQRVEGCRLIRGPARILIRGTAGCPPGGVVAHVHMPAQAE